MQLGQSISDARISNSHDRQNLELLRKRFGLVNEERLRRMRMSLNHQQDVFINVLPLLFHCNHPMLPGFVSHTTPSGVSSYKPCKRVVAYGKSLARSFSSASGYHGDNIWGIYLMGSVGTLAQSHHSDFDVWLCHKPGLGKEALQQLKQKCQRISQWAKTLRLDTHFFLMDCDGFVAGSQLDLDDESSGSAQRMLLLDEFYRTALHIAGRLPLWWFVPAEQDAAYQPLGQQLLDRRFLLPESVLDFGAVGQIPEGEFVGASIWQLYKAISSPYKSVIKLLLMEAYVHDFPTTAPLSLDFKAQIYAGNTAVDDLDPYLMIYRRIEQYLLSQGDHTRLELVRRCFYFKVNKPLSRSSTRRSKSWQRLLLERLVQEWGWQADYVALLDQRRHWKALQVKQERNQLVQALNRSYEVLQEFTQRSGSARAISCSELAVLGRKLQAAFERRPGKLEWINPGISNDVSEQVLHFVESPKATDEAKNPPQTWQLCGEEAGTDTPLRQTDSPVELLLWSYTNQVIDGHVRFDVSRAPSTSETQLKRTLTRLQQWLPLPLQAPAHAAFEHTATPTHVLMLVNVGAETPSPFGEHVHRLSDNTDPFCYGGLAENLVASVDVIVRNSWQEFTCKRFCGGEALVAALKEYASLCLPGSQHPPPILELECLGNSHAALISQRCQQWLSDIVACYYTDSQAPATRFLFALGKSYYSVQLRGPEMVVLEHKTLQQLLHHLGQSHRRGPIIVDRCTSASHPLKRIARRTSAAPLLAPYLARPTS